MVSTLVDANTKTEAKKEAKKMYGNRCVIISVVLVKPPKKGLYEVRMKMRKRRRKKK